MTSSNSKYDKKAVILTLFRANNIGAFLQAYSMMDLLQNLGYDTSFGFLPDKTASRRSLTHKILGYIKAGDIRKLLWKAKNVSMYREIQATLPTTDLSDKPVFDAAIIGSDEVWSINNPNIAHQAYYLGHEVNAAHKIAYAPCGNGITASEFRQLAPNEKFSEFTALSARDNDTLKTVEMISGRNVTRVVDPTMLIESFDHKIVDCKEKSPFILVYSYGIDKQMVKAIKKLAKSKGLKLISVGTYNSWCDQNVIADPWEFLGYLKAARYVITSTFHGTILSIKFNKQFICLAANTFKVIDALSFYNLSNRNASSPEQIPHLFNQQIDYDPVNTIISTSRNTSMHYLKNALAE